MAEDAPISPGGVFPADGSGQLFLDGKMLPVRPELVAMVKAKEFHHTGKIASKDQQLCLAVVQALIMGVSGREIAKQFRISRHTVYAMEQVLREQGKLEPLKKATLGQLDKIIHLGLERLHDALAN